MIPSLATSMTPNGFTIAPDVAIDLAPLQRVLVIMLRHHGDVLLTSPLYSALKTAAPHLEIDALIYRETLPMLEFNPHLAQVHTIDKNWKYQGLWAQLRNEVGLLKTLGTRHYDLIIHLTDHRRGIWLTRWLKPRFAVAPKLREASKFWNKSFTHLYACSLSVDAGSPLGKRHVVEQHLDALRRIGMVIAKLPALYLAAGRQGEAEAAQFLQKHQVEGDYVLIQPTSRWLFKCGSVESNADLICRLLARGETIVLSCAPDARERAMIWAIVAAVFEKIRNDLALQKDWVGRLKIADDGGSLHRLAALIGGAAYFIGVDSVPMHIAAAMATPTIALFGPSGEFSWRPWQVEHRVVTSDAHPCRPCGQDGCGGGKLSECLTTLPVARVLQAVDEVTGRGYVLHAV